MVDMQEIEIIRIDKLLYYLRFAKSRSISQKICETGHVRMDGKRIISGHEKVQIGSTITMPRGDAIIIFIVDNIPKRRGSATEAQSHYHIIN